MGPIDDGATAILPRSKSASHPSQLSGLTAERTDELNPPTLCWVQLFVFFLLFYTLTPCGLFVLFFLWFTLQQHGKQLYSPSKADTEEKQLQQTDSDVSVCRQPMNSEIIKAHSEVIFASETQRSTFVMSQREQLNPTRCLDAEMWSPWFWPISIRHGVLVLVGSGKHLFLQDAPNKGLNVLFYAGLHIGELSVLLCLEFLS